MTKIKSTVFDAQLEDLSELSTINKRQHGTFALHTNVNEARTIPNTPKSRWEYYINEYGYRGKWNLETEKPRIGFLGCSNTFGIGVQEHQIFANLVSDEFKDYEFYNLGLPSASIERISHVFSLAAPLLKLDIAIFSLPTFGRSCFVMPEGIRDYIPGHVGGPFNKKFSNHFLNLMNEKTLDFRAFTLIDYIITIARLHNVRIFFNTWEPLDNKKLLKSYPTEMQFPGLSTTDLARDRLHPGPRTHREYADIIINFLKEKLDV